MSSPPLSSRESNVSPSSKSSSSASVESNAKTQLETLVAHVLAAKRSLSSIHNVWRANEIVTSARSRLEESVVLSSRNTFLRRGVRSQVQVLRKVRQRIEAVARDGHEEFMTVLGELDAADGRLETTLEIL